MKHLSNKEMPVGGFDFVLLGQKAKDALIKTYQPHTFMQARILDLGFKRAWFGYNRRDRLHGVSKWTLAKKFTYMLDGVLGHSYLPIRIMSAIGALFSLASFFVATFFLVNYLINGHKIQGWTPIILSILFVGGVQIMMIGVLGEYLWRVLAQVRGAPPYIIEEILESAKS
jgi:dolichol-phosphate mannosyltransferase